MESPRRHRRRTAALLAFGLVAATVQLFAPGDAGFLGLYAVIVAAIVTITRQVRRVRPPGGGIWHFASMGMVFVVGGNVALGAVTPSLPTDPTLFLVPGSLWLIAQTSFMVTAIGIVARQWGRKPDRALVVDAFVVFIAVMVPVIELIIRPALSLTAGPLPIRATNAAFLVFDGIYVVLIAQLILTGDRRNPCLWFMTNAVGVLVVADLAAIVFWQSIDPRYLAVGWMVCYISIMLTVLHPQLPGLTRPAGNRQVRLDRTRTTIIGLALMTVPMTVVAAHAGGGAVDTAFLMAAAAVVAVLVLVRLAWLFRDREAAQAAVETRERYFRALVQNIGDVIRVVDLDGTVRYQSPAGRRLFGWKGTSAFDFVHADDTELAAHLFARAIDEAGAVVTGQLRALRVDGLDCRLEVTLQNLLDDDDVASVVLTCHDVTERYALEEELRHEAYHDALTGLPNRALALDRLDRLVQRSARSGSRIGVAFVDVDNFKTINDTLGHAAGDQLLRSVSERLTLAVRPQDTVARLGGDEFLVLVEADDEAGFQQVPARLVASLSDPHVLAGKDVWVTVSVGFAVSENQESGDEVLRHADLALYRAKDAGRNAYCIYTSDMDDDDVHKVELEGDLRRAVQGGKELRVYFQPVVQLDDGRACGVEALVRWEHPERGLLLPGDFIPQAEANGLIVPLGRWVLREACRQVAALLPPEVEVAVNLSARQLEDEHLVASIKEILAETGLEPRRLTLELTETVLMSGPAAVARLHELKALGVHLAVDDFGTGYSSLAYLRNLPIDTLKVDRQFISTIATDPDAAVFARGILDLARTIGLRTIAEGVEEEGQLDVLRDSLCGLAQGYLFARPMPLGDVIATTLWAAASTTSGKSA